MNKFFRLLSLAAIVGAMSTSCMDDNKENYQEVILTYGGEQCFNIVTDKETGEELISGNPNYKMTFEQIGGTLKLEISNVQFASGYYGLSFKLPTMNFTYDTNTGYFKANGKDLIPTNATGSYIFNDFSLKMVPTRIIDEANCPIYLINYTVNDKYDVTVIPTTPVLVGTTTSAIYEGEELSGETFTLENRILSATVDPVKKTARIVIPQATFEEQMMPRNIVMKNLPVTISSKGFSVETAEGETIQIYNQVDNALPDWTATNLKFDYDVATGNTTLTAHFKLFNQVGMDDLMKEYDVKIEAGYFFDVDAN
ncbi:MAG: hypothetical protein NC039_06450 [Muribaculaceae bacterium]|nr:hypothetical protein [Muribaculaceae bacterium]